MIQQFPARLADSDLRGGEGVHVQRNAQLEEDDEHIRANGRAQHTDEIDNSRSLIDELRRQRPQRFRVHDWSNEGGADPDQDCEGYEGPERRIHIGL